MEATQAAQQQAEEIILAFAATYGARDLVGEDGEVEASACSIGPFGSGADVEALGENLPGGGAGVMLYARGWYSAAEVAPCGTVRAVSITAPNGEESVMLNPSVAV